MQQSPVLTRHRFGATVGRNGLINELQAMKDAGVHHIGLHFLRNHRPVGETMEEIATYVLPVFHGQTQHKAPEEIPA